MKYFLLLFALLISIEVSSQKRNTLKIIHANKLKSATFNGKKGQKLIGDVAFKHGKTLMYCDSAFSYRVKIQLMLMAMSILLTKTLLIYILMYYSTMVIQS
jgi:hypothetical protein